MTIFRVAAKAMKEALQVLLEKGTQAPLMELMMTRKEQYEVIKYNFYEQLDKELSKYKQKNP